MGRATHAAGARPVLDEAGHGAGSVPLMLTLTLASASPARAALLRAAGVRFRAQPADLNEPLALAYEEAQRGTTLSVGESTAVLARAKAEQVARSTGGDLILGCDSLLEFDGESWGKPGDAVTALARWRRMRGREAVLHTGHWLIAGHAHAAAVTSTTVHFAEVTDQEIEAYVASGEPLNVAGAFTIDGRGGAFVRRIEGDHHAVVGLSLPVLRDLMTELGVAWVNLWDQGPEHPPIRNRSAGP